MSAKSGQSSAFGRALAFFALQGTRYSTKPLAAFEGWLGGRKASTPQWSPTFLVGPPRSGTTLLYQSMCRCLKVAFPTNLMVKMEWHGAPRLHNTARALIGSGVKEDEAFSSEYGHTIGWTAPHEAGQVWNRWFPFKRHHAPNGTLSPEEIAAARQFVATVERGYDAPFVNKNVMHSMRIESFVELFPEALFVEVLRDPLMTAQSILIYRQKSADPQAWWSVTPKEVDDLLGLSPAEQSAAQVYYIQKQIDADRARLGAERFLTIRYQDFCSDPNGVLGRIAGFMGERGAPTEQVGRLPETFRYSSERRVSESDFDTLRQTLVNLGGEEFLHVHEAGSALVEG